MVLVTASRNGKTETFAIGETAIIGRGPGCEVLLEDPKVSRRHAQSRRLMSGNYVLSDLGSTCGTFVQGKRVTSAALDTGVSISIGDTVLSLQPEESRGTSSERW